MCTRSLAIVVRNLGIFGVLLTLATAVQAAEVENPPPWWNSDDGRTVSESFDFPDNHQHPTPLTPSHSNVPDWYSDNGTQLVAGGDAEWFANKQGRQGVWGISGSNKTGSISIWVWNLRNADSTKTVWLQYDAYHGPDAGSTVDLKGDGDSKVTGQKHPPCKDLGDGWTRFWKQWQIKPQPASEEIKFTMATGPGGGTVLIDNISISTHCEGGQQGKCEFHPFDLPAFPPVPAYAFLAPETEATVWGAGGTVSPVWLPAVTDQEGVLGMPPGGPGECFVTALFDDVAKPEGVQHVAYQYDYFLMETPGAALACEVALPPECAVLEYLEVFEEQNGGWMRRRVTFDVSPPPDWHEVTWIMSRTEPGDAIVIDNFSYSAGALEPNVWSESFSFVEPGGLHGQNGWKGWDDNPLFDALVGGDGCDDLPSCVEVLPTTDLVQEFNTVRDGQWVVCTYLYVPGDFESGCGAYDLCGSFLVLLDGYQDGGPYHWALQLHADSITDSFIRDGATGGSLPLIRDAWVRVETVIDFDADLYRVYYDGVELGEPDAWSAGVTGDGLGALQLAALDLYGNNSSPVRYDDFLVKQVTRGDLNDDGEVTFDDINPFVLALSSPAAYAATYPMCPSANGDINRDGAFDFKDINPFVLLLSGGE